MRTLLLTLIVSFIVLLLYWGIRFYQKVYVGVVQTGKAVAFNNLTQNYSKTLLVLGDSVAVGVGAAKPEDSVAGLLSRGMGATYTENNAVSGAQVSDLFEQIEKIKLPHYNTILIQIGGNDIIRFHSPKAVSAELGTVLDMLAKRADRVLLMSAGDVGTTTIFPPPLRPFYSTLNAKYHAAFSALSKQHGATYINLYTPPAEDPFVKSPSVYFSADGLHLTSEGYALWYKRLQETVTP